MASLCHIDLNYLGLVTLGGDVGLDYDWFGEWLDA